MITNDETDIATGLGPEDGAGDLGVPFQNNETTALRMQATEAPLNDMRVRQAINYAVNRDRHRQGAVPRTGTACRRS